MAQQLMLPATQHHTKVKQVEWGSELPMVPTERGTDEKLSKERIQALEAGEHSTEN